MAVGIGLLVLVAGLVAMLLLWLAVRDTDTPTQRAARLDRALSDVLELVDGWAGAPAGLKAAVRQRVEKEAGTGA